MPPAGPAPGRSSNCPTQALHGYGGRHAAGTVDSSHDPAPAALPAGVTDPSVLRPRYVCAIDDQVHNRCSVMAQDASAGRWPTAARRSECSARSVCWRFRIFGRRPRCRVPDARPGRRTRRGGRLWRGRLPLPRGGHPAAWLVRDVLDKRGDRRLDLLATSSPDSGQCGDWSRLRRAVSLAGTVRVRRGGLGRRSRKMQGLKPGSDPGMARLTSGAAPPARNQGPGGSLPGQDAGHPCTVRAITRCELPGATAGAHDPSRRPAVLGDICRRAVLLPEALDRRPAVQRDDLLGLAGPVHEGRQVLPALPRQPPVLDHAGR